MRRALAARSPASHRPFRIGAGCGRSRCQYERADGRYSRVYSPPELRTSQVELLGTTTGMILTAVVAILGLAVLLGMVFLADGLPPAFRSKIRRGGGRDSGHPRGVFSGQRGRL